MMGGFVETEIDGFRERGDRPGGEGRRCETGRSLEADDMLPSGVLGGSGRPDDFEGPFRKHVPGRVRPPGALPAGGLRRSGQECTGADPQDDEDQHQRDQGPCASGA
jgi:hypothetical protein